MLLDVVAVTAWLVVSVISVPVIGWCESLVVVEDDCPDWGGTVVVDGGLGEEEVSGCWIIRPYY